MAIWKSHVVKRLFMLKPGEALVDAEEDLLAQVLGERGVAADEPEDVVVDRSLVGAHQLSECFRVAPARSSQLFGIRLWDRHKFVTIQPIRPKRQDSVR